MRLVLMCALLAACGEEEKEEFGLPPPQPGAGEQIHIESVVMDPEMDRVVCQGRQFPGSESLVSGLELLARPPLKTLEVYVIEEEAPPDLVDCTILPHTILGELSDPIRMIYYSSSEANAFQFPGDVAVRLGAQQPLLLRYRIKTGAEPEELEIFLNLTTVPDATVVAPFTFSNRSIHLEPRINTFIETTCPFNYNQEVVTVVGHQRGYLVDGYQVGVAGTGVTVEFDGQELLSGPVGPWAVLEPLSVPRNQGLTFTCWYDNRMSMTIENGLGEFDETCRISGWLYPADGPVMATAFNESGQQVCNVVETSD